MDGRFTIQLKLSSQALFPTSEMAFLATEEFLAEEHRVHEALKDMKEQKQARHILHHVPPRPVDVDPERYFSPPGLDVESQ